jgi:hypothetical protein
MTTLPSNYEPSEYTVVIGKGRVPMQANGTKYLRVLAQNHLGEYSQAMNKTEKTNIVTAIMHNIEDNCADDGITFVKYDNGVYSHVPVHLRREKIAATFRDLLSFKYKSSSHNKTAKRLHARKAQRMERQKRIHQRLQQQNPTISTPTANRFSNEFSFPQRLSKSVRTFPFIAVMDLLDNSDDITTDSCDDYSQPPTLRRVRTFSITTVADICRSSNLNKSVFETLASLDEIDFQFPCEDNTSCTSDISSSSTNSSHSGSDLDDDDNASIFSLVDEIITDGPFMMFQCT